MLQFDIYDFVDESVLQKFKEVLSSIPEEEPIQINIHSDGGLLFSAITLSELIKRHKSVTTHVTGLAAGVATLIFIAAKRRIVEKDSLIGILPLSLMGKRKITEIPKFEKFENVYLSSFNTVLKTKLVEIDTEYWFNAQEALDIGLATEIA